MRHSVLPLVVFGLFTTMLVQQATAQQYVQKWDVYSGYAYLNTPTTSLSQNGFNITVGRNLRNWIALGADFSYFNGAGAQAQGLAPLAASLPLSVLQTLPPALAGATLQVPYNATTMTFAIGPQFQFRKKKWVTPFFHPFLGAFHSKVEGKVSEIQPPAGVSAAQFAQVLALIPPAQLNAVLNQSDTVVGYGVGVGVDLNLTRPVAFRFTTDYIRTGLFASHQNNVRIATGIIYRFGGEIAQK